MVHSKLQVGTEETPFRHKANISLSGTNKTEDIMNMGTKVLGVMGGTLELHVETRPGWARLAQTAEKGSSTLALESAPNWRPGDRIVLASTDYWADHSEEVVVKSVSGSTVTLESALSYQHWGSSQSYAGQTVDEQAEVGLLSRNVVVEGEETSSADGFGVQIMVMNGGQARLEGVELNRMGQKNVLRRYPIHFHMLGDAPASYVKNSVVHHAFNRCLVVHGTNRLAIEGNVCHAHIGHGYLLEVGAQTESSRATSACASASPRTASVCSRATARPRPSGSRTQTTSSGTTPRPARTVSASGTPCLSTRWASRRPKRSGHAAPLSASSRATSRIRTGRASTWTTDRGRTVQQDLPGTVHARTRPTDARPR